MEPLRFDVYQDRINEWRWRLWAGTRIIADSAEGYQSEKHCYLMIHRVKGSGKAPIRNLVRDAQVAIKKVADELRRLGL